jgi:hypothetical protein
LLARIESVARITSLLFIPIAIALTGWWVQSSVAEATIKKDYVAMAMGILKEGKTADPEILTWAAEVVKANSPTPLSNDLRGKIVQASLAASQVSLPVRLPPKELMESPEQVPPFPKDRLASGTMSVDDIVNLWIKDRATAERNGVRLKYLEKWITETSKIHEDHRKKQLQDAKDSILMSEQSADQSSH